MTVPWDESFSVGVPEFDEQHKRLLAMIHRLAEPSNAEGEPETVPDILREMREYAAVHFRAEEVLMQNHDYPEFDSHHQEHATFLEKLDGLCQEVVQEQASVSSDLLEYLVTWWTQHILKTDMKYRSFFTEKGARP
jgi:hemerythrin